MFAIICQTKKTRDNPAADTLAVQTPWLSQQHNLPHEGWRRGSRQGRHETTRREVADGWITASTDSNTPVIPTLKEKIKTGCVKRGFGSRDFELSFQSKAELFTTANNH